MEIYNSVWYEGSSHQNCRTWQSTSQMASFFMKLLLVGAICSAFFLLYMCMCGGYTCVITNVCTCMYTRLEAWVWFWLACSQYPRLCLLTLELYVDHFDNWAFIYVLHYQNLRLFCLNVKHFNCWATSPVQCSVFKEKSDKTRNNSRAQLSTLEIWKNLSTSHMRTDDPQSPDSTSVTKGLGPIIINSLIMKSIPCSRI